MVHHVSALTFPKSYFKTPPLVGKKQVVVHDLTNLRSALAAFGKTYRTTSHVISLTGDVGGASVTGGDVVIDRGGTADAPLVVMMPGAGTDSWKTRKRIYNSCLVITAPYVWLYGLWMQMLPVSHGHWRTKGETCCVVIRANNTFVTACRMSCSQGIFHVGRDGAVDRPYVAHNWYEIASQAVDAIGSDTSDFGFRSSDDGVKDADLSATITNLVHSRNRFSDHPASLGDSKNFRALIIGNGHSGAGRLGCPGSDVGWNLIDAHVSHGMETKRWLAKVHHNHITSASQAHAAFNTRGENASGPLAAGVRPIMYANRADTVEWQLNLDNWDYVNCWMADSGGALGKGSINAFPRGLSAGKDINGSDGCRFIGCKANLDLGYNDFEADSYDYADLGRYGNVLIARHQGGAIVDGAGKTILFKGDPGHPSGSYQNVLESAITKQSALPAGFVLETPPVLTALTAGPAAPGLTWSGKY